MMGSVMMSVASLLFLILAGCSTLQETYSKVSSTVSGWVSPKEPAEETMTNASLTNADDPSRESPAPVPASEPMQDGRPRMVSAQSAPQPMSKPSRENKSLIWLAQEKLKAAGFDPGPVDGVMGPKTRAALIKYQTAKGLQKTGRLDDSTVKSLGLK